MCEQGLRVGVFGIMADGQLRAAWFEGGVSSAQSIAKVVNKRGAAWGVDKSFLALDGEKALHAEPAASAFKDLKFEVRLSGLVAAFVTSLSNVAACVSQVERIPPTSPDVNPIGGAWARLDERLRHTDPAKLETAEQFKTRVGNAVRWLNKSEKEEMVDLVDSMPRRLAAVVRKKGAASGY